MISREKKQNNTYPIQLDEWTKYFQRLHNTQIADNIDEQFQKTIIDKFNCAINSSKQIQILDNHLH